MNLANKLTILRVILIPVFIAVLMIPAIPFNNWIALGIFVIASFTDMLDGQIARKMNMVTNFGKFMDPLADKLLVCSALLCLMKLDMAPWYLVLVIIFRDFIISGFRLIASDRGVVLAANNWGKVKTVFQMVYIGVLLGMMDEHLSAIPTLNIITIVIAWAVLVLTVFSLFVYIFNNYTVLLDEKREK